MDLKRYEEITSEEAIKRIINKEEVFDENEKRFFSLGKSNTVWVQIEHSHGSETSSSGHTLEDLLDKKWFVKKPFDVRKEMLARPNEWVGAFENSYGHWFFVGFDTKYFKAICKRFDSNASVNFNSSGIGVPDNEHLDRCIPIDDGSKEELT